MIKENEKQPTSRFARLLKLSAAVTGIGLVYSLLTSRKDEEALIGTSVSHSLDGPSNRLNEAFQTRHQDSATEMSRVGLSDQNVEAVMRSMTYGLIEEQIKIEKSVGVHNGDSVELRYEKVKLKTLSDRLQRRPEFREGEEGKERLAEVERLKNKLGENTATPSVSSKDYNHLGIIVGDMAADGVEEDHERRHYVGKELLEAKCSPTSLIMRHFIDRHCRDAAAEIRKGEASSFLDSLRAIENTALENGIRNGIFPANASKSPCEEKDLNQFKDLFKMGVGNPEAHQLRGNERTAAR